VELIKIKEKKWVIGLILLFILYFLVNSYVLHKDNFSPVCDSANTILSAFRAASSITSSHIVDLHSISHDMSPLLSFLLMLNILVFGGNIDILMHTNLLFLVILMYSLYNLGKRIGDKSLGFAAVVVCLSFPAVFGMSRIMWHEFPLMCIMTLSYYLLFKTDYFKNTKYSFLWALTIACGFLIKFTLPIYIFVPMLIYVIKSFFESDNRRQLAIRLLSCFLIVLSITGWWYTKWLGQVINLRMTEVATGSLQLFNNASYFYNFLCNSSIYAPFFLLFIISIPLLLLRPTFEKLIIMIGIFVPIVIFLIAPHASGFDSSRYFVPILPLIALSIANLISLSPNKFSQYLIFFTLILLSCAQFLLVNFGFGDVLRLSENEFKNTTQAIVGQGKIVSYVSKVDPNEILDLLNRKKTQEETSILFLGDFTYIESCLRTERTRSAKHIKIIAEVGPIMGGVPQDTLDKACLLDSVEFVLALDESCLNNEEANAMYHTKYLSETVLAFNIKRGAYRKIAVFKDEFDNKIALFQRIIR